jgi:dCMP deaminase
MIVNAGIRKVVYAGEYPDPAAARLLEEAGVELVRYAGELRALAASALP